MEKRTERLSQDHSNFLKIKVSQLMLSQEMLTRQHDELNDLPNQQLKQIKKKLRKWCEGTEKLHFTAAWGEAATNVRSHQSRATVGQ
jgi:polyphosphate kinase